MATITPTPVARRQMSGEGRLRAVSPKTNESDPTEMERKSEKISNVRATVAVMSGRL